MYLADENFGILKRDVEIAEHIKKCKKDFDFPQSIFFYKLYNVVQSDFLQSHCNILGIRIFGNNAKFCEQNNKKPPLSQLIINNYQCDY